MITASPLSSAKSLFCKFVEILLVARDPLRHRRADLKIAKETLIIIIIIIFIRSIKDISKVTSIIKFKITDLGNIHN